MIASCLACSKGQEVSVYCKDHPDTRGCDTPADGQPADGKGRRLGKKEGRGKGSGRSRKAKAAKKTRGSKRKGKGKGKGMGQNP